MKMKIKKYIFDRLKTTAMSTAILALMDTGPPGCFLVTCQSLTCLESLTCTI